MTFENPNAFFLLILLPLLWLWQRRQRKENAIPYSAVSLFEGVPKTWRQRILFLPPLLLFLSLSLLITALAKPMTEVVNERQDRQGIAIEILIDVSSSMSFSINYGDKELPRMDVAKKVVEEFIMGDGQELTGRPDDLLGIITFARYPDTICPMTLGHSAVAHMVRELKTNERMNEDGTAFADAIALAAARLADMENNPENDIASKVIILLTDGENNSGKYLPLEAARIAQNLGIKVYAISIDSQPKNEITRNADGSLAGPPEMSANAKLLEKIAKMTGGIYRAAWSHDSLKAVYNQINDLEKTKMKAVNYTDTKSAFSSFAVASLILLSLYYFLQSTILRISP